MSDYYSFESHGLTVEIHTDQDWSDNANPRTHDGNLGVMSCAHPRYDLGDEDAIDPRDGIDMDAPGEFEEQIVRYLKERHGARVILPLFLYDHSGITISAGGRLDTGEDDMSRTNRHPFHPFDSAGWDTSSVGVIFDTADSRKECGCEDFTDEQIEEGLRQEVKYYDAYLTGMVFGYIIREEEDGEELDSCWGFLDPDGYYRDARSYVYREAEAAAEACAERVKQEQAEAHEWACRDTVTV